MLPSYILLFQNICVLHFQFLIFHPVSGNWKITEMNRDLSEKDRRKKNNLLAQYYGTNEENVENPLDLDGKHFQAEVFVDKLVKVE